MLSAEEITYHIKACGQNSRASQKVIYSSFYSYAMVICYRYTKNPEDAVEILNEGFLKIFKEIHRYKPAYANVVSSFKGWLRAIMVYTAIDHLRRNNKHKVLTELGDQVNELPAIMEDVVEKLTYKEIMLALEELTPVYQKVFKLYVIGGLSHDEISKIMKISVGTSKSNLFKAKKQLRRKLLNRNDMIG